MDTRQIATPSTSSTAGSHPEAVVPAPTRAERRAAAIRVAQVVASRYGIPSQRPRPPHDHHRAVVHLAPSAVVAKVATIESGRARLATELAVARHLAAAGTPVVPPSPEAPVLVHEVGKCGITRWRHEEHDPLAPVEAGVAGWALRQIHEALETYLSPLPSFLDGLVGRTAALLAVRGALPGLTDADRAALAREHTSLIRRLLELGPPGRPLHGDPHRGNLPVRPTGRLMIDLEAAGLGPPEWDLSALPGAGGGLFPVEQQLLVPFQRLRSVCVAVRYWHRRRRAPELAGVAQLHLAWLPPPTQPHHPEPAPVAPDDAKEEIHGHHFNHGPRGPSGRAQGQHGRRADHRRRRPLGRLPAGVEPGRQPATGGGGVSGRGRGHRGGGGPRPA
jgi:hypothetical protein